MSGNFRRRHSKWDHKDSEAVPEDFHDRAQTIRPREPVSPIRESRRRDSRSKERNMTWDRDDDNTRISTGPGELRQNHSRSPRNGWGRLHSGSRSRSRSRSPSHYLRREPAVNDRSRSRSGAPAKPCRDFVAGRCRRGSNCHFLHQDPQSYDSRQPVDCSPTNDWESAHRGLGGSKYSSSDLIDDGHRDRDVFHKSRDAYSRRNHDREPVDGFEKERVNDIHSDRDRDNSHRSRDTSHHRSRDRELDDVFENGSIDDIHRNKDNTHRSRDSYYRRNHDREPADVFENRDMDNSLRTKDTYNHRNHDRGLADGFEKRRADDVHRVHEKPQRGRDAFQNHDREPVNVFEKGSVDDAYRDRDNDHRGNRDRDRDRDREPRKRGETICKFFASGNCLNGNRCRFIHEVRERRSPVRRSHNDKWGSDNDVKAGNNQAWDGSTWSDMAATANTAPVRGWGGEMSDVREITESRPEDNSRSNNTLNMKETWERSVTDNGYQMPDKKPPLQWDIKNITPSMGLSTSRGVENTTGDLEISPSDVSNFHPPSLSNTYEKPYSIEFQEQKVNNDPFQTQNPSCKEEISPSDVSNFHPPSLSNTYEKPYSIEFQEQKVNNDPFQTQNPSCKEEIPSVYHGEEGKVSGINDGSCAIQVPTNVPSQQPFFQTEHLSQTMNALPQPGFLQTDGLVSGQPTSIVSPLGAPFPNQTMNGPSQQHFFQTDQTISAPHFLTQTMNVPPQQGFFQSDQANNIQPSPGVAPAQGQMQFPPENTEGDRKHLSHNSSSFLNSVPTDAPHLVNTTASGLSTVSTEQLAQLSNLSASLAQLLENRQQLPQLGSAFGSTMQPNQVPEVSMQQYDPMCDSVDDPTVHNLSNSGPARDVEQKSENKISDESGNTKQQESVIVTKDDEKSKIVAGNGKEMENKPSEDVPADEGDDGNKSKETKAIRPFKFALAEFVKELLKPSWKDGQVSKDAYKTIVKKVVDKIIDTQGLQIPQTKDKIDQYLSCSKPKIDKLVQAYVGKFQKN